LPTEPLVTPVRCSACQLLLCKSRKEPPHQELMRMQADALSDVSQRFICKKCGAVMINSADLDKPGWFHQKAASATNAA